MANLQFGINLYPHQWRDAARIEELGYDSVWTSEHVFFYFPTFDALTTLAAVGPRRQGDHLRGRHLRRPPHAGYRRRRGVPEGVPGRRRPGPGARRPHRRGDTGVAPALDGGERHLRRRLLSSARPGP